MNKRIRKKVVRNFMTTVETSSGPIAVHVNRRGCKRRWTEKDQQMLAQLAEAALKHHSSAAPGRATPTEEP